MGSRSRLTYRWDTFGIYLLPHTPGDRRKARPTRSTATVYRPGVLQLICRCPGQDEPIQQSHPPTVGTARLPCRTLRHHGGRIRRNSARAFHPGTPRHGDGRSGTPTRPTPSTYYPDSPSSAPCLGLYTNPGVPTLHSTPEPCIHCGALLGRFSLSSSGACEEATQHIFRCPSIPTALHVGSLFTAPSEALLDHLNRFVGPRYSRLLN